MTDEEIKRPRPYWHMDAKWIAGLLLTGVLTLTMLVHSLAQITDEEFAVDSIALALVLALAEGDLDDESALEEFLLQVRDSPDGILQLVPGLRITVQEEEIAGLSPREAAMTIMRKVARPLYHGGSQGLADLADDPELADQIIEGGGLFNIMTRETHYNLRQALPILVGVCLLLLVPLVFFSYRFGRLGSPGFVVFAASLPGAFLFSVFSTIGGAERVVRPGREEGITRLGAYVASEILPPLAQIMARNHLLFMFTGIGLMAIAILGSLIYRSTRKD
jgi:hypothetical protein